MVVSMVLVRVLVQQYHENHEHRWQKNWRTEQEVVGTQVTGLDISEHETTSSWTHESTN